MRTKQQRRVLAQGSTGSAGEGRRPARGTGVIITPPRPVLRPAIAPEMDLPLPPVPPGEELPLAELDGIPDWNAQAWLAIQARDAKALAPGQLVAFVAGLTFPNLHALMAELGTEPAAAMVRAALETELARRRTA